MKIKLTIISIAIFSIIFALTSCSRNEDVESLKTEKTLTVLTFEQLKMRSALETTTNILLDMISKDQTYFDELNNAITAGSPNYLADRVMMKDLFNSISKSGVSYVKTNSNKFVGDFKATFANKPQKVRGVNPNSNTFSNSDSLIQYLTDNNVSLYCPYPLEDYSEGNRIPAISYHPIDNDPVNIGYLFTSSGNVSTVTVDQAYANKHPVWILKPFEKEDDRKKCSNKKTNQSNLTSGYEVMVKSIYCKQYYGGIFDGDLNMHIIRMNPSNVTFNVSTNSYSGGIVTDISFRFIVVR